MARARIFELDVLRGFAIFLVMGVHVPAYPIWSTFGGFGVDLFFVLSGFLISNLLFNEYRATGDIRLKRFFFRRAMKLYPSFWLLLIVTAIYALVEHVHFSPRQWIGEMLLTQNYIGSIWGHTWSLSVEEHFYILLPLALAWMLRRGRGSADPFRAIPVLFGCVAAACLAMRYATAQLHPEFTHQLHYQPSHLRIDSLLFGVFLSYLHNFRPDVLMKLTSAPWRFPITLLSVAALLPALVLPYNDPVVYTVGFTLLYFAFGTMLVVSLYKEKARKETKPGLALRGIARMGFYSYTLYLWHVPLAQVFGWLAPKVGGVNPYLLHAVYFATCIVAGVTSSKLVELPLLKLRERLSPAAAAVERPQASDRGELLDHSPAEIAFPH
jgi:peptidoglycan/LPS O-acetylase OafA/YrhL